MKFTHEIIKDYSDCINEAGINLLKRKMDEEDEWLMRIFLSEDLEVEFVAELFEESIEYVEIMNQELIKSENVDLYIEKYEPKPITQNEINDSYYLLGYEHGFEKGRTEQVVRNFLKHQVDVKTISDILEITPKYVKQIQAKIKREK